MQVLTSGSIRLVATTLLFLCQTWVFNLSVYGQATCSTPSLISGFGVDGDVHANTPVLIGGDSWFYNNVYPGTGIGVIGLTAATAQPALTAAQFNSLIQSASTSQGRNRTYVQRMGYPSLTVVNTFKLIDAFAARDNISPDTTAFTGSNKNGDNPSIWNIGISSVPNKNDIIDVGGHLRRFDISVRGSNEPALIDTTIESNSSSVDDLWMFAFVTKLATGGDSYTDIEIYRTVPILNPVTGKLTNTGPAATGGHTAFLFNNDGTLQSPGDIILCMNYGSSGGVASVRIWCNINNLDGNNNGYTWFNTQANRPFNFTGDFMIGSGTNGYGYAEIASLSGAPCLVFSVLNSANAMAGAWGNLTSSSAVYDTNIQPEQLVNIAFNFTEMGLDFSTLAGPCANVFGALFYKTRSSSSYSSELKDCCGPFVFGNFSEIQANAGPDKSLNCITSQVTLDGSSATPGANISWTTSNGNIVSGSTSATPVVNAPGTYIITAQNPSLSSCIASDTVVVILDLAVPGANAGADRALTCSEPSLTLNGSSPVSGATFSWIAINGGSIVSGANTATPVVNAAGCYVLTVTNPANGCTGSDTMCVTMNIGAATITATSTVNVACYGGCDGALAIAASGGQAPYTYLWSNGSTATSITGLCAGGYTVTVTGANGCTSTQSYQISQPTPGLSSTAVSTQSVSCTGGTNGAAAVNASGGTLPYTYLWSTGSTSPSVTALIAGTYTVTVTDGNGCTSQSSVSITQPAAAVALSVTSSQNISCYGGNNGFIDVTPSGGTPTYSYLWNNGTTTQDLNNITAGTYTVTVTDANGCSASQTVILSQPSAALGLSLSMTQPVACYGGNSGSASSSVSGGTLPYTYLWSTGAGTSAISSLSAGVYSLTVTDANGCTANQSVSITQPSAALSSSITATQPVSCFGGSNGSVNLSVAGGTSPYSYQWNNGATTQDLSNVIAGTYTVTVTDTRGCTTVNSVTVTQPSGALNASAVASAGVSCFGGNNGAITLTVTGGTAAYSYQWSTGAITQNISGLISGTYIVTVTDANNCVATTSVQVTQPAAALSASISVSQNVSCFGGNNGSINLAVSNGTAPYTYQWSNGATTQNLSSLATGTYTVTITDANGCTLIRNATVNQPAATLNPTVTSTGSVSCFGGNDGSVNLSVSGGTAPYTYLWNNGATTQDLTNVSSGTYNVTITDANGCIATAATTVTQPTAALTAGISSTQQVSCFSGNNGTITLTVSGGTTLYSYSWSNGATSQNISGLSAGTYTVTVTDARGCVATASQTITQPSAALSTTANVTQQVSCFGGNNGSINLSVSGGTTPYSYNWSNGSVTEDLSGLAAGSYTVTVTDANGCTSVKSATIIQPSAALSTGATVNQTVSCYGGNDGSANLSVTGGTAPYSYLWSNGTTTQNLSNVGSGTFTVTVSDNNGCTSSTTVTITQPSASLSATVSSSQQVSCFGGNNGSVNLNVSGGTSPYNYAWSNGSNSQNLTGLSSGTYTVIVTDARGCTDNASLTITQPAAALNTSASVTQQVSCFGGNNGSINLTATGGTTPYTYSWSNGSITEDITNLSAGTYTVTVTDVNGCTAVRAVTITQPAAALSVSAGLNQAVSCFGGNNGQIATTINGGTSPYTYLWSNGNTSAAINNLVTGTYTVSVTDANGCTDNASATVTQPSATLSASTAVTSNISCFSGNNGAIDLTVLGGTAPYTYMWSTGAVTQDLTGLPAGTFTVTITDANGCTFQTGDVITQPVGALAANLNVSQNVNCFGGGNGALDLTVSGGTLPYTYLWSNGAVTEDISGLGVGVYTVSITDVNGCISSATGTITQPSAALNASVASAVQVSCFGGNNGAINLTVTGGTIPYSYNWSNGATSQDINNLVSNTYTVTITDVNGCTFIISETVSQPTAALNATLASSMDVLCYGGANGSITLNVTGGTTPYSYVWSNGATTQNLNGLSGDTYSVLITDVNGCNTTLSVTIAEPAAALQASVQSSQAILCYSGNNGEIILSTGGGTAPYAYLWNTGATTSSLTGLTSGTYTATVTDANGCSETVSATLTQPVAPLSSSVNSTTQVSCFGGNDGSIDLTVAGGTAPYSYTWSNGSTNQDLSSLAAGTYTVTITDANGCTNTLAETVNQPAASLSATLAASMDVLCYGGSNGSITLNVTGGTTPYTYTWSNGATTQNINGLSGDTYTVLVTDVNGCNTTLAVTINEPAAAVQLTIQSSQAILCHAGNNGEIVLNTTGGTSPYTYLWNNGATTPTISGLTTGTYTATVTDANGCTETVSATLSQPISPLASSIISTVNVFCFAGNDGSIDLDASGGTAPYTYTWSNGATTQDLNNLPAGIYTVLITDANGCTETQTVQIDQPAATLNAGASVTANVLCNAGNNGSIDLTVTGGTTPYVFIWNTGDTSEDLNNLTAGTYTVTITDMNGCTATASAQVTEPIAALSSLIASSQNVNCFGGNNGAITLQVSGGTAPYTFLWSNGDTTQDISGLVTGTYIVNITDANGCSATNMLTITQPQAALSASLYGMINVSCNGGNNGNIDVTISGGTLPYTFVWNNGETTEDISNLVAGTYTVTVTDANGCTTDLTATITEPLASLSITVTSAIQIDCFGGENGSIDLTISGGTAPYTYAWNTGETTEDLINLGAGTFSVVVTDANGCFDTLSVTLTQPAAPLLAIANVNSNVNCFGGNNGNIDLTVNGGTMPYTFLWSNGEITEDISNLATGNYTVTVTDANGCSTSVQATVSQPAQSLSASATTQDVLCFNGNNGMIDLTVIGGTPPYTYNWSNGATSEDVGALVAGIYTVTITDANGCDTTLSTTIIEPSAPLIPVVTIDQHVSCHGGNDGAISVAVSGGTPPYVYLWSNGATSTSVIGLPAGQYVLTVTDANGCNAIISDFINEPAASLFTPVTVAQNVSCFGGNNGSIVTNVTGGTSPYTYLWNTGAVTPDLNNLSEGSYTVTVTDSQGCTFTGSATVSQPAAPLSITGTTTIANCLYGIGGDVTIQVNGGTIPYNYQWSNGSTTQNLTNMMPASYTVTVTDANGCTLTETFTVNNQSLAVLEYGDTIICVGEFTTLWVDTIPGATYQWYFAGQPLNGATAPSFTTPAAGYYYVSITTICGTFNTDSVEVQVKSVEDATISNTQIVCPPEMVQLHATGGVIYEWTPNLFISATNSPDPYVGPAFTTTYTVHITNEYGCEAELSVEIGVACDTLFVPNGFSPNSDGTNDGYVIDHIDNYPGNRLWVYNRWGNLVYKARDYKNDWNGIANVPGLYLGKKVPAGTYFFILDLNDGSKPMSGYLIIRY